MAKLPFDPGPWEPGPIGMPLPRIGTPYVCIGPAGPMPGDGKGGVAFVRSDRPEYLGLASLFASSPGLYDALLLVEWNLARVPTPDRHVTEALRQTRAALEVARRPPPPLRNLGD